MKPPSRRRLLAALAAPAIRPAAAARPSLTLAAPAGLFQDLYEPAVIEAFHKRNPGIRVFWYGLPEPTQTLAVLRRQAARPELDVVLLDPPTAALAAAEGLLEPMTAAAMPVLSELAPSTVLQGGMGATLCTDPLVLLYDPSVTGRPPGSWKALWSGGEDETLALSAPPDPIGVAFAAAMGRVFGGGTDRASIEAAMSTVAVLRRRIVSTDPRPDPYRFVADGHARISIGWNMAAQFHASRLAERLSVAFPLDGTVSRVTTIHLVRGARQPDAARQLVSWLLGAEAQKLMVETLFLGPVNTKARFQEAALARTANTPARAARAIPIDWAALTAMRDALARRWAETMSAPG